MGDVPNYPPRSTRPPWPCGWFNYIFLELKMTGDSISFGMLRLDRTGHINFIKWMSPAIPAQVRNVMIRIRWSAFQVRVFIARGLSYPKKSDDNTERFNYWDNFGITIDSQARVQLTEGIFKKKKYFIHSPMSTRTTAKSERQIAIKKKEEEITFLCWCALRLPA